MRDSNGAWIRPREKAWGNDSQRAVLHAIAEDMARRSGYRVAAIEALRSDGNLEFVAIAGSEAAREQLMGRPTPLDLDRLQAFGTEMAGWVHIPGEHVDDETREWMAAYGHRPEETGNELPGGWHPDDRLLHFLRNDDGELRGTLYLDEPLDGTRPTPESMEVLGKDFELMFGAVVGIVERELYGEQVRMVSQARAALQSVRPGLGMRELFAEVSSAMVEQMTLLDSVDILLAGEPADFLEPDTMFFEQYMLRVWNRGGYSVVEPTETWGIFRDAVPTPPTLAKALASRGLGSWLMVPIGLGEEYLGTIGLGRARGTPRWIDSEINAAAAVARDLAGLISGARLVDRERTLNAELRSISDYRRDMVLTVTHELRNPVTVLWTHLEMLAMQASDSGPESGLDVESVAAMRRATQRIENMIEDLLALASVDDPERELPRDPVDFAVLVRECELLLGPVAAQSEVDLHLDLVDGVVVHGEATGLERVVTNLMSNAIKYTAAGGLVEVTVAPAAVDGVEGVRLTCRDTGFGIDAGEVDRIFRPFFRSGNASVRRRPGAGLGLAIVERVVNHHQGAVDVESVLGEGTTFTVWLPRGTPDDVR